MRESGLARPTAHRILRVLVEEGAVEQDASTRRYMIGQEVSLLGLARTRRFPIRAVADPFLRALAEEVGDTVFLTIRSGHDSICVDRKAGSYPIKVLSIEIGARRPLGVGVGGLALLAFLPEADARLILKAIEPRLAKHRTAASALLERMKAARTKGYAYTDVGVVFGTRAVAVPVFNQAKEAVAAISVAAIADRLAGARLPSLVSAMQHQAGLISKRLAEIARARR